MKILVVTGIFPPDIGGPASYIPRISGALSERGHAVEVVTLSDRDAVQNAQEYPFRVHRIERQMALPFRVARTVLLIRSLARDADVVFSNGLVLETIIAAKMAAKPVVVKVVGDMIWERARSAGGQATLDDFQGMSLPFKWRALRALQRTYMRMARRMITPSDYLKRIVLGWGVPEDRTCVVYNAIPHCADAPANGDADIDIVSVGRLVAWKGFDQLIDIAGRRRWSLSIVGDGPLRQQLEDHARETGGAVRFEGRLPQAEIAGAIRRARVFVLNSSYEGLPHIVLEAMAAGVPVVATAVGGTPETIIDGVSGFLVPVDEPREMEEALGNLVADKLLRDRVAAAARAVLADRFSFERMVSDTEEILASAARAAGEQGILA